MIYSGEKELKNAEKFRIMVLILLIIGINILLSGCYAQREPQNRNYIMCMGIDLSETGWQITYSFPDLAALTGTDSTGAEPVRTVKAASLQEAAEQLNGASDKIADYSQMSVIMVGHGVMADGESLERLIEELKMEKSIKRTVLLGRASEEAKSIVELDEDVNGSIGVFLYELCQNNYADKGYNLSVLEDFAGGRRGTDCVIPVFEAQDGRPQLIRLEPLE